MLTTIDKLKESLGIPVDDHNFNGTLLLRIAAASQAIETYCKRSFRKQQYTERVSGYRNSKYINLRNYPVHEIIECPLADYMILEEGRLYRSNGWPVGEHNLLIRYIGGYVLPGDATVDAPQTLPESLELACILYAQTMQRQPGVSSERVGDISVSYANEEGLSSAVEALISPYRSWL